MTKNAARNTSTRLVKKTEPACTLTAIIGRNLVNLAHIAYTKRYQPLNESLDRMTPDAISRLGVGINSLERQIAFDAAAEPQGGSILCWLFNQRIVVPDNCHPSLLFLACFSGSVRRNHSVLLCSEQTV